MKNIVKLALQMVWILVLVIPLSTSFAQNKVVVIPLGISKTTTLAPIPKTGQTYPDHTGDDGSLQIGVSFPLRHVLQITMMVH